MYRKFIAFWDNTSFYLRSNFYYAGFGIVILTFLSFFAPVLFTISIACIICCAVVVLLDSFLLYRQRNGFEGERIINERLSNGDENKVTLQFINNYDYTISCKVIDELPFQFQERTWQRYITIPARSEAFITYNLKPNERGEYQFGNINVYAYGPLQFVKRRYRCSAYQTVKVYPSYVQMRRYQLSAVETQLQQAGVKRMRKLGHSMEFEQIKEYVRGEDYRTINWKATARHGDLMVNNYTDERSQQIYCVINKGRVMKMPFGGMTLLDYAINASLVLLNVALQKQDRAGLITFGKTTDSFLLADKKPTQINHILENLYKQNTDFLEPDFERLFSVIRNRITQRSLLILFTNFETIESLQRELPFLKRLAHYHLLMVIFFENTELKTIIDEPAHNTEEIYIKTIAGKYYNEKHLIAKELQKNGILAVVSSPEKLTVNSLNKYLELKNKQSI